ncbi:MAG TPA: ABC transporter permease [Rhizomicrobium sp.]|nr:ABC transporter permease [Rhizomicrobium sp.]
MSTFLADVRYGLRTLARNPGFSAIVILILALGIGANTAMFSIVDGVLLRPLPFRDPERLFAVQEVMPKFAQFASYLPVSAHHLREWRTEWHAAEGIAIFNTSPVNLTSGGEPQRVVMGRASAELFQVLGVEPQLGRNFLKEEDRSGSDQVVLMTDALWESRFHSDPEILGKKILVDGAPFEVVGVLPRGLRAPKVSELQSMHFGDVDPDLWKPLAVKDSDLGPMGDFNYAGIVRLTAGVSREQALAELNAVQDGIIKRFVKEPVELRAALVPLQAQITGRSREGLLVLLGAVGAVLLIVCVNIANLLLSRATGRQREFAIRAAVGASSRRLLAQVMTESFLIAVIGGGLGLLFANWALAAILANAPSDLPRINEMHLDARAIAVALSLSLGSAVLFGLLPALRNARSDPQSGLRGSGRSVTEGRHSGRVRSALVAVEVGLSTVCLVAAGLLLNSFLRLMHVDRGYDVERITTATLNLPVSRYPGMPERAEFLRKLLEQVRALPGVTSAAVSNVLPLTGEGSDNIINAEGSTVPELERPVADFRLISEDYFATMGVPLLRGRAFEPADRQKRVGILSAATAERLWPGQNPLGKKFRDGASPLTEVVGVARDVRANGLQKAPTLTMYMPYWQKDRRDMTLAIRTAIDPAAISGAVRGEVRKLDAELPVPEFRTMQQIVAASVAQRRFQLTLVMLFAGIGLALASLGIYGVVSYSVEQRRGEMGIRMALGATGSGLRALVLRQGLAPVLVGLAGGVAGAIVMSRILQGLLFGVHVADPLTLGVVATVLLAVAAAACYVPASRVARADPLTALRYE